MLKAELTELLPFAPIVSLLIELDRRTGFLDCFTHAGGKQARTSELKRNLLAVLIANATNLGLIRMAEACGISHDVLAWTAEWYVREETLRAANLAIVSYHQRLPLTQIFGGGTLSSSDGQRFPTKGKSLTALNETGTCRSRTDNGSSLTASVAIHLPGLPADVPAIAPSAVRERTSIRLPCNGPTPGTVVCVAVRDASTY